MQQRNPHPSMGGFVKWLLLTVLAVALTASLFLWKGSQSGSTHVPEPTSMAATDTTGDKPDAAPTAASGSIKPREEWPRKPLTEDEQAELSMLKATQARTVKAAIHATPVEGAVSQRPEFVSEVEWDIFTDVVDQTENGDVTLSHLVNKLLFFKKRDAWLDLSIDSDSRRQLAEELLAMIPGQLSDQSINQAFADKMTDELNTFLE